jgi:HK97 family phage prohead protease
MTRKQKDDVAQAMKSFHFKVKDAEQGTVTAVFSTFNVKDYDDDVTLPGAFEDGAKVLISAYGHKSWMGAKPVGRGVIHADDTKAWLEGQFFLDTIDGDDTFKTIKGTDELQEWSYGFDVLETGEVTEGMRQAGVWRVIKKAAVYEVCPVMLGAGIDTRTLSIKSVEDRRVVPDPAALALSADARRELASFVKTNAELVARS